MKSQQAAVFETVQCIFSISALREGHNGWVVHDMGFSQLKIIGFFDIAAVFYYWSIPSETRKARSYHTSMLMIQPF